MDSKVIEPSLRDGTTEATCADIRRWMDAALHSSDLIAPSPVLSAHIEGCAVCQGALLVLIAAGNDLPPSTARAAAQHCLDDLPAYIDRRLEDPLSAIRTYPHVWWHLLTCRTCRETYRLTRTMIEGERRGQLAPLPRPGQPAFPALLRLSRRFLNHLLAPSPLLGAVARGSTRRPVILAEEDTDQGYAITLSVEPQPDGAWRVLIRGVPPPQGQLLLTLGEASFRSAFNTQGVAVVADVPAPLLLHADGPDLVVCLAPDADG
jgi:hypothetical protein